MQVIGHTPLEGDPDFRVAQNTWNIDTGAYRGNQRSALRISATGSVLELIGVPTVEKTILAPASKWVSLRPSLFYSLVFFANDCFRY
jgi:serine/threonine protein phosphatase 1